MEYNRPHTGRRATLRRRSAADRRLLFERLEARHLLSGATSDGAASNDPDPEPPVMVAGGSVQPARVLENLGRGVIAVRSTTNQVFISWRLLGLDPEGIAFNLYRSANGGAPQKLNGAPLTAGTNFTDTTANMAAANEYFVRPVLDGIEQQSSDGFVLSPNTPVGPLFRVPLRNIGGTAESQDDYYVAAVWVGDLDGDGEYDFVVARIPNIANTSDVVEGYRRDGTFLWSIDMGPNSLNKNNIEPGPSTIMVGNWDGVTVADLDLDGKAEVAIRTANGVVFGDGAVLSVPRLGANSQFMSIVDGMTGAERARIQLPGDYFSDGPLAPMLGVGYLDSIHPSLVAKFKNRVGNGPFNMMVVAWDFDGVNLTQKWKWLRGNNFSLADGHQIRIVDVDQDGRDEIVEIGFVLNGDGTLKYSLGPLVIHGDRFHIGDLDPGRPGLEGFGVQQDHANFLLEYYYDAATGEILHTHYGTSLADVGRGIAADIDPNHPGYEYWSFSGIYNSHTPLPGQTPVETKLTNDPNRPWPNFRIWWDGDVLSENLNRELVDKWNPATQGTNRLLTAYQFGAVDTWRDAPPFYGDIFGDWREEIIFEHWDHSELQIFTSPIASNVRLYTLPHNPAYRNGLTLHGYYQSHMVDYYLGAGMSTPPTPNIVYASQSVPLPGDYDRNGTVNALDHSFWKANFGATSGPGLAADGNGDGIVDTADYTVWRNHLTLPGVGGIAAAVTVSESTSASTAANLTQDSLPNNKTANSAGVQFVELSHLTQFRLESVREFAYRRVAERVMTRLRDSDLLMIATARASRSRADSEVAEDVPLPDQLKGVCEIEESSQCDRTDEIAVGPAEALLEFA